LRGSIDTFKVCNLWHETVKSTSELQYTIELWADGMVRGDSSPAFTCAEALKVLRDRRRAWRNLEWTSKSVVQIEGFGSCIYDLVGGVFAQQPLGLNFLSISLSRLVDEPENAKSICSHYLDLEDAADFRIDPSQDLIAFLFLPPVGLGLAYLELRTMSSQQPHPLAAQPHLAFLSSDLGMADSFQIVDDIIGIFSPQSCDLELVNWRAGNTIAVCSEFHDLFFLSQPSIGCIMLRLDAGFPFPIISLVLRSPCKSRGTQSVGERTARDFHIRRGGNQLPDPCCNSWTP
jgi:hypothetical protein